MFLQGIVFFSKLQGNNLLRYNSLITNFWNSFAISIPVVTTGKKSVIFGYNFWSIDNSQDETNCWMLPQRWFTAIGQSDFDWIFAFGHNVRETKSWNVRNIPLECCLKVSITHQVTLIFPVLALLFGLWYWK